MLFENLRPRLNGVSSHAEGVGDANGDEVLVWGGTLAASSIHAADALAGMMTWATPDMRFCRQAS